MLSTNYSPINLIHSTIPGDPYTPYCVGGLTLQKHTIQTLNDGGDDDDSIIFI